MKKELLKSIAYYEKVRLVIAIIITALMTAVFFGMAIHPDGLYVSDTPLHIDAGILLDGYGLETIFIFFLGLLTSFPLLQLIFAVAESFLVMLTWLISLKLIERYFTLTKWIALFISTGLIFVTALYIPVIYPYFYAFSLGSQPWHNSTYFGMRLFAVVYLYFFYGTYPTYLDGIKTKSWWTMALSLAVATMFKPNFLLTVCISLATVLLAGLLKHRNMVCLKSTFIMGLTVVLSMIVLAVQYILIYKSGGGSEESGIAIVFFSNLLWEGSIGHMLLKFARSFFFPLYVWIADLIVSKRDNRPVDPNLGYSLWLFFVSVVIYSVFKETGSREYHGNFGWGIPAGLYIVFIYAVPYFFQNMLQYTYKRNESKSASKDVYYLIGIFVLFWHLISGIVYFVNVAQGVEIPWSI
ncbi:MAG: hypothetical protein K5770_14185 [Lachnospiraceae bacterium]|nr:hypothetical protein [Lachnospiraceae bacterium]